MIQLAAAVLQAPAEAIELSDGFARIKDGPPEAALPFMALGAIVNANNAFLPPEFNPTLNHRYVCRPYFGMVDTEKKTGQLTLTYATQIHAAVVEIDPETGEVEIVDYAAVDDCGVRINPQIVEGQVHGATAHAIGAALHEEFVYDEEGTLLTANFYDYHVPHAMDMPPLKTGAMESPSPVAPLGAKGMGEGGGGGIHCICAAIQDALRAAGGAIVYTSCNPPHRVWSMLQDPEATRANVSVSRRSDRRTRDEGARGIARDGLERHQRAVRDGEAHARRRELRDHRREALDGEGQGAARPRRAQDDDELREARGAAPEFASMRAKGQGVGALMDMTTSFTLSEAGGGTSMAWEADVKIAGPSARWASACCSRS